MKCPGCLCQDHSWFSQTPNSEPHDRAIPWRRHAVLRCSVHCKKQSPFAQVLPHVHTTCIPSFTPLLSRFLGPTTLPFTRSSIRFIRVAVRRAWSSAEPRCTRALKDSVALGPRVLIPLPKVCSGPSPTQLCQWEQAQGTERIFGFGYRKV